VKQVLRWQPFPDAATLSRSAADFILAGARKAISKNRAFHVVLAGGETPRHTYEHLATANADWSKWHVYFGDERCLPVDDAGRNDRMARGAWLDHVPIPHTQVHPIPAELGPQEAAVRYNAVLKAVPDFDLVLLGLGEDGHTASLFPSNPPGTAPDTPDALAVHNAPKPPAERVTLSARRLSRAAQVLFLVSGATKRNAIAAWRGGASVPAAAITPRGEVRIYTDIAARG